MAKILDGLFKFTATKKNQKQGDNPHVAAVMANLQALKKALTCLGPNHVDEKGRTALHLAVLNSFVDGVEELCKTEGIDANIRDADGRSALHYIVESAGTHNCSYIPNALDMLKHMLDIPTINVDIKDAKQRSPLDWAAANDLEGAVGILTAHKANIASIDSSGQPLLHRLVHSGRLYGRVHFESGNDR
jgi:ankyrin repeat protein